MADKHDTPSNADWRSPISFTSWIPLHPTPQLTCIETLQEQIEASLSQFNNEITGFCEKMEIVHSCRIVVTPPIEQEGYDLGLLINLVHDNTEIAVVEQLSKVLVAPLGRFLQTQTEKGLRTLIYHHRLFHKTFFIANIHRSVKEIKQEQRLYRFLQNELDLKRQKGALEQDNFEHIRLSLRKKVIASAEDLPKESSPDLTIDTKKRRRRDLFRTFLNPQIVGLSEDIEETIQRIEGPKRELVKGLFFFYKIIGYLFSIPFGLTVRLTELFEKDMDTGPPPEKRLDQIEASEDVYPKNSVTLVFPVKHSRVRRFIMNVILSQAEKGCRHFWTVGKLVQINTLHYARIFLTSSRKTMIFMSDYDGGLDRYLDDFLGVGQRAVVAISSSVHGCPPTKLFKPANISDFRGRWRLLIRRHQYLDAFWYSAYPDLEVDQIMNHHLIREGLFAKTLSQQELETWLRKF